MSDRSGFELESGEGLRYRGPLRRGGEVAVTDDRVLVRFPDETVSVRYERVSEVTHEGFDWFLGLVSAALVGFGLYGLTRNPAVGGFFVLAGCWSLYRTYRQRDLIRIRVRDEPKPVEIHPEEVDEFYPTLAAVMDAVREDRAPE